MTSHNDITGDKIQTKITSHEYRDNYDRIFGKDCYGKPATIEEVLSLFNKEVPCCGGSASCTAPCIKEKENDRQVQESK